MNGGATETDVANNSQSTTLQASLCGNYNIGAAGTFTTLDAAVAALNSAGASCAVTFTLVDASYAPSGGITINQYPGSSATNTLTIKPGAGVQPTLTTTAAATFLLKLNGADYVTVDGSNNGTTSRDLTLASASTAVSATVWLSSLGAGAGAINNTVKNVNLAGGADQSTGTVLTFGILTGGTAISITSNGANNDNNTYQNNFFQKVRYGVFSIGTTASPNVGTVVTGNLVGPAAFGANSIGKGGIVVSGDRAPPSPTTRCGLWAGRFALTIWWHGPCRHRAGTGRGLDRYVYFDGFP